VSFQRRRRGQAATVYPGVLTEDRRGNKQRVVDMNRPIPIKGVFIPQRSARAEVPGQAIINVTRILMDADLPIQLENVGSPDVGIWGRVEWNGHAWDIVTPPAYHHGTRHTRHWTIDIRERP